MLGCDGSTKLTGRVLGSTSASVNINASNEPPNDSYIVENRSVRDHNDMVKANKDDKYWANNDNPETEKISLCDKGSST